MLKVQRLPLFTKQSIFKLPSTTRKLFSMDIYDNINFSQTELERCTDNAKDWAICHGIVMKNKENTSLVKHAPFTLFPSPFPMYLYEEAMKVQSDFQRLIHRASLDHQFIKDSLKSVIIHDTFTKNQFDIYNTAWKEGCKPKLYFSIMRSDYMINEVKDKNKANNPYEIKQIEVNVIAASFGGLDSKVSDLHQYVADELGNDSPFKKRQVALKTPLKNVGIGLAKAFKKYGDEDAVVVVVVQGDELNRYDQRHMQYSFQHAICELGIEKHVNFWFRSLQQISQNGKLTEDKRFILEGKEVSIFYFRAGYTPGDFAVEENWKIRLMIERSVSVKCPTMAECLVGTKKIQQVFALPGVVERFLGDDVEAVKRVQKTFTGLYSLDPGEEGDLATQNALNEPFRFVLKPQREGGGNNLYDEEMVAELHRITDPVERSKYILMERIRPPVVRNYIVHNHTKIPTLSDTVSELGIFGVFMSDGENELINEASGHLLRTKSIEHKDGGVAAGRAVLDTPYLI